MDKDLGVVLAWLFGLLAVLFGAVLTLKAIVVVWNTSIVLIGWVVPIAVGLVNLLVVAALIGGVILLVLLCCDGVLTLVNRLERKCDDLLATNQEILSGIRKLLNKPEKVASIAITAVVQSLIIVVKELPLSTTMRVLLSVAIWVFAGLLNLTLAERGKFRTFGVVGLTMMIGVPVLVWSAVAFASGFRTPPDLIAGILAVSASFGRQSIEARYSILLIGILIGLIPLSVYLLFLGRKLEDKSGSATPDNSAS